MKECWAEGDLRAYVDRELAPEVMEKIGGHLRECTACQSRYGEIAGRAARVTEWMSALPEVETPLWAPRVVEIAPRRAVWPRAVAVGAVAAGLLLAGILLGRHEEPETAVAPPAAQQPETAAAMKPVLPTPAPEVEHSTPLRTARAVRPPAPRRAAVPQKTYYMALDDEPIEAGVVVRMALDPGAVQADVIVGLDGRA